MKTRFTTVDIIAIINELKQYIGYRVIKVYDIDCKTFLIKLSKTGDEGKTTLLVESGTRIHTTEFDWPKNSTPSGMSMKLRKHIKNRRLTSVTQLGSDRIVDLQFGSNECACHFIAELYDKGNLILTDFEYTILHLGRTRVENVEHKLMTKERYPIESATFTDYTKNEDMHKAKLKASISEAKQSDNIRKIASSLFIYGPNLLEHCLINIGYTLNTKLSQAMKTITEDQFVDKLYGAMIDAQQFMTDMQTREIKGYIYGQRKNDSVDVEVSIYEDFHPVIFNQMVNKPFKEMASFNAAVDLFFSSIGTQKTEQQICQKEKAAMKKLENIRSDHEKRLRELQETQELDRIKGEMIENNLELVNNVIFTLNHAIANQVLWDDIKDMIKEGQKNKESLVSCISSINLECNKVTLRLRDPYEGYKCSDDEDDDDSEEEDKSDKEACWIDTEIDLSINAHSNARQYFTMKKAASSKEQKTLSSTSKAMKSAEIKTKQMLTEVQTVARINKARKVNWFEKFNWFISSENYLVIGGKDQSQNEVLVKRYLRPGDIYVHADVHGASTVVVQNHQYPQRRDIPPKTLNEAGNMAVVYSGAWASKISSAAWWVYHDQVSKTAPSGEYLTAGSFMIRGKKNYLPVLPLTFGFGVVFKLSDESVQNHVDERKVKGDQEEEVAENSNEVDEFEEVLSEESDSEFPNAKIENETLEKASVKLEEKTVNGSGGTDRHKYVSAKERRDQKKGGDRQGCDSIKEEHSDAEECDEQNEDEADTKNNIEVEADTKDNIEVEADTKDNTEVEGDTKDNIEVEGDTKDNIEVEADTKDNTEVEADTKDNIEAEADTKDNIEVEADTKDNIEVEADTKDNIEAEADTKDNIEVEADTKDNIEAEADTKDNIEVEADTKDNIEAERDNTIEDEGGVDIKKETTWTGVSVMHAAKSQGPVKRRQAHKLKKMKEKYKDQDEEERELKIAILHGKNPYLESQDLKPLTKKEIRKREEDAKKKMAEEKLLKKQQVPQERNMPQKEIRGERRKGEDAMEDGDEVEDGDNAAGRSQTVLNTLTGAPVAEDELMYALPVCAPYQTLQNYRFKVKMLPGTTKRGKAGKTVLFNFAMDRGIGAREKDLIKALKDQDVTRNFPGTVKMYTPNVTKNGRSRLAAGKL